MAEEEKEFALRIVADKKPYFMRYIYPTMMRQYNTYIANTDKKSLRLFGKSVDELAAVPPAELTADEQEFLELYRKFIPVGFNDCVMNQVCRKFEEEFDGYIGKYKPATPFDPEILKSGAPYTQRQYRAVEKVYKDYTKAVNDFYTYTKMERLHDDDYISHRAVMMSEFVADAFAACQNRVQLCDILVDICYKREASKQFLWDVVGDQIIENLLNKNGRVIQYPAQDPNGDVRFRGKQFTFRYKVVETKGDIPDGGTE